MTVSTVLTTGTDSVLAAVHSTLALAHYIIADNGGTVNIPSVTPPGANKWLRIPGLVKWAATIVGVTAIVGAGLVMAVEKFTDHSVGNKGMKIAAWAMGGGIVVATAPQLYAWATA